MKQRWRPDTHAMYGFAQYVGQRLFVSLDLLLRLSLYLDDGLHDERRPTIATLNTSKCKTDGAQ